MNNSEKILKLLSRLVENGILSSQDVKKEIKNILKFRRDELVNKLDIVTRQEFEVLKKIIQKQGLEIKKLSKKKLKG